MVNPLVFCNFEGAHWLVFGPNVPAMIYYSHITNISVSLIAGFFLLYKARKLLASKILFFTIISFVIWVFAALVFWASNRGDVIMFTWLIDILVEPLVYIGGLYFLYTLVKKADMPFSWKLILGLIYAPLAILLPSKLTLSAFDVASCLAVEGPMALYYSYFIEIFASVWLIAFAVRQYTVSKNVDDRKKIVYLSVGVLLFLFAFAWGNIIGSFTDDWALGDYGLFGMPIFIGFLIYSIVKFRLFNLRLIGANVLVIVLWLVTASLLSIQDIATSHAVVAVTLILTTLLGFALINAVRKEAKQLIQIEELAKNLEISNKGQENLIHIMNHQIKGYLGVAKIIFAELLSSDDFGNMPEASKPLLKKGLDNVTAGVDYVQGILKGASAQSGTLPYDMKPVDVRVLVLDLLLEQKEAAEQSPLKLSFTSHIEDGDYKTMGDAKELEESFKNLITNAIKYNSVGGKVEVSLVREGSKIIFSVKDQGVGISEEDKPRLFTAGGMGKESTKYNSDASGFGLVFVKGVAEAHKGKVSFRSNIGERGTTFYMEIPVVAQ